ncbi:hypothetical protein [Noviherbaspirillum cavernae]|uniref:hypothetical protein n=1 Tax=Noviherbaspirillum cavernae TaxID=2320862 RepID=UPI0013144DAD|nr:hypothetical protein [Noviherbaspirillum cavernae]
MTCTISTLALDCSISTAPGGYPGLQFTLAMSADVAIAWVFGESSTRANADE